MESEKEGKGIINQIINIIDVNQWRKSEIIFITTQVAFHIFLSPEFVIKQWLLQLQLFVLSLFFGCDLCHIIHYRHYFLMVIFFHIFLSWFSILEMILYWQIVKKVQINTYMQCFISKFLPCLSLEWLPLKLVWWEELWLPSRTACSGYSSCCVVVGWVYFNVLSEM